MLKIGEFAHLSGVSIRLLRYYDEIGLLKPSQIDKWTSYRSYGLDQLPRLNRILALKDLGLSLEQIAKLLDEQLPADYIRGMLRLKQAELQQQVEEEQARLRRVEQRLQYIEQEGRMPKYDMVIKRVEAHLVASIHEPVASFPAVGKLIDEVMQYVTPYGVAGYDAAIWHDIERPDGTIDAEGLAFIDKPIPASGRVSVYELPTVEVMAATIHHGSYNNLSQAYAAIIGWIEANGYKVSGPSRELYMEGGGAQDDESFVTEIQFPVVKELTMPTDLKKELKALYNPSANEVSIVKVPAMNFLMIDGEGDPSLCRSNRSALRGFLRSQVCAEAQR